MPEEHVDNHEAYQKIHEDGKLMGALPKKPDRRNLMMVNVLTSVDRAIKQTPKFFDWKKKYRKAFEPYHNQSYGSCTISSQAEAGRLWERREQFGRDLFIPEEQINKRYFRLAGDPNWESGQFNAGQYDQGLYELDALNDFRTNGFSLGGRKYTIDAFTEVGLEKELLKTAIFLFRGIKICYDVTETMYQSSPDAVVHNDNSAIVGGHSMFAHGYSDVGSPETDGLWMTHTWNRKPQLFAWDYVLARATEAYSCIDAKDVRLEGLVNLKKLKAAVKEAVAAPASEG